MMNVKTTYPKERLPYFEWIAYLKKMKEEMLEQEIKDKQKRKY